MSRFCSVPQEDERLPEGEQNEALVGKDTITAASSNYAERRSEAIAAKAREIEKVGGGHRY